MVSAGEGHVAAVTQGGGVFCWGGNDHGQLGVGDLLERMTPTKVKLLNVHSMFPECSLNVLSIFTNRSVNVH
jgi:alpha-tubulin suppressor-like RCC1 family protein